MTGWQDNWITGLIIGNIGKMGMRGKGFEPVNSFENRS